jgi:two-component system osmolarity sensor histidine kinase EnvZ
MPDSEYAIALATGSFGRPTGVKRLLPRTLFARFLLIIVTPVVLAQLVATWIFYDRHWETVTRRLVFAVSGEIALVIQQLDRFPEPEAQTATLTAAMRTTDLVIRFEPGASLPAESAAPRGMLERTLGLALTEQVRRPFTIAIPAVKEWYEIRIQMPGGVLQVLSPERRLYSPTSYIFILWMIGSALVLFTIAIVFMRNQVRSIRRLAQAADSFGKGRDVPHFKPEGAAEVRQAAAAFLVMRARIQRQIKQRTEMLAGVSHDLRTPLTRMKLALAMLGDNPGLEVEELQADVAEMEMMIDAYLAFARGEGSEPVAPADLGTLLGEVVAGARRAGGVVELDLAEPLRLPLRTGAMKRAVSNLLANARRHARRVEVRAGRRGYATIEITIDDDGPGIPADQREEVFKPFFRLDSSRNPETGGAGLGLAIARDVVRGHGGDITLEDSPMGGLRAVIRLPV